MQAYELHAKLKHLTLTFGNEDGEPMFIGTQQEWNAAYNEMREYEFKMECLQLASNHN